jgi:hypothetical protein
VPADLDVGLRHPRPFRARPQEPALVPDHPRGVVEGVAGDLEQKEVHTCV